MQKIDRLGWAAGVCVSAFGRRIGIRTDHADVVDRVVRCLPPGAVRDASPIVDHLYSLKVGGRTSRPNTRQFTLLYSGLSRVARTMDLDEALSALSDDMEQYLALRATDRVFLHAGVVGWKGRAIVLPGKTFAGKSTLVAALQRAGATYYSDEFAVLDGEGRVHPYARPLAIRKANGEDGGRWAPEHFGAPTGVEPLPIGLVAMLSYRKDADEAIRPLPTGRAALQLVPYAYCATDDPERAVVTIAKAVRDCRVIQGTRGEADAMTGCEPSASRINSANSASICCGIRRCVRYGCAISRPPSNNSPPTSIGRISSAATPARPSGRWRFSASHAEPWEPNHRRRRSSPPPRRCRHG